MMRKFLLALFFVLCAPLAANAANCYWVAGTSYNSATSWSSASGGSPSTCGATSGIPKNAGDTAFLDAGSPAATTLTLDVDIASMATIDMRTLTGGSGFDFSTHSVTFTASFLGSGTGTRSLTLGSGTITIGNGALWNIITTTGMTFNAGTATLVFKPTTTATNFFGGGKTYSTISVAGGASAWALFESGTNADILATNLTVAAGSQLSIRAGQSFIVTNAFNIVGTASLPVYFSSDSAASTLTTLNAGAASSCQWCIFRNVTGSTSAITATNSMLIGGQGTGTLSISNPGSGGGGQANIFGGQ